MTVRVCIFCDIVAGALPADIVHRTERTVAFRDISPKAKVHVLVIPTDHHADAAEVAAADPTLIADMVTTARQVAQNEGVADSGYRMIFNTGADGGQTVFHAHLHLLAGQRLPW